MGLARLLDHEVKRAAFSGRDPDAIERVRFTVDLPADSDMELRALASALCSSRRALASKLLSAAVEQWVQDIQHEAREHPETEFSAVLELFGEELARLRAGDT